MDIAGFVIGALGLGLSIASIALIFAVERVRSPQVQIELGSDHWPDTGRFAHIAVINQRSTGWLARRVGATTAGHCRVSVRFARDGVRVLGPLNGRWSGAPEPRDSYDYPLSYRWDLAATGIAEQIAIAITGGGSAHAFSAESYDYRQQGFLKPEWQLDPGVYDVDVRLTSTEAEAMQSFRLVVSNAGKLSLGLSEPEPAPTLSRV